jgi:DNA-binding IclR family transcriptional regulator
LLELARLARRGYGFGELATPIMASLAERFHQTVLLTRRAGASIVCIERQESEAQYVRLSYERGTVLPINAGASAVVLLAWLPEDQVRALLSQAPLHSFTPNTLVDPEDIVKRLATIRDAGYAITQGEVDPDVLGVAVPVRGRDARVEAGLSFVIMKNRFSGDIDELVGALLEAARKLGELVELAA